MRSRRLGAILGSTLAVCVINAPAATAYDPPPSIPEITAQIPSGAKPTASIKVSGKVTCAASGTLEGTNFEHSPAPSTQFSVDELSRWGDGSGVTVAVIDSGVTPNTRLPRLRGGGDYIDGGDGLSDCDHHGTLVAGIIAAEPSIRDGFRGVAPGASILSLRQTSVAYESAASSTEQKNGSRLDTVARAIVRATNLGADVINISVTACVPTSVLVDTTDLGAALKFAHSKNVGVIASAGNNTDTCKNNAGYDPAHPNDMRNWAGVSTLSFPSYYAPSRLLLSVGGIDITGAPYADMMTGPWVSVGAPATQITSLDPTKGRSGGLTNAQVTQNGIVDLEGTSFAAAYVSGLLAILKGQFPSAPIDQLYARILRTAQTPSADAAKQLGWGTVDPIAALTADVETTWPPDPYVESAAAPPTPAKPASDYLPVIVAVSAIAIMLVALLLTSIAVATKRNKDERDLL
jgi:membrane-anchored mycosin MYCP